MQEATTPYNCEGPSTRWERVDEGLDLANPVTLKLQEGKGV